PSASRPRASRERPPLPAVAREELVRLHGAGAPGLVALEAAASAALDDRPDELPGSRDLVSPPEERLVAPHAVEEEVLVRFLHGRLEALRVAEVHGHPGDLQVIARDLAHEAERDPLVGLDPEHEDVRLEGLLAGVAEQQERDRLEVDRDLRDALPHLLPGAE